MEYITPMFIGSIIGYFTNWLAIRMLFRPYEEKRLFGFKIPFTPGMIPKERARIAKSVGETVEDYLLTPEGLIEIILSEENQNKLRDWLKSKKTNLIDKDLKLSFIIDKLKLDRTMLEEKISYLLVGYILDYLADDDKKLEILVGIESIYDNLSLNIVKLVKNKNNITEKNLEEFILAELEYYLENLDGNIKVGEFISEDILEGLDCILDENKEILTIKAREILTSDKIQMSLLESVRTMVDENVSRLVTTFISSESIVAKIVESINKYIFSDDFDKIVTQAIESGRDEILNANLSKLVGLVDVKITAKSFLEKLDLSDSLIRGISGLLENQKTKSIEAVYSYLSNLSNKPAARSQVELVVEKILADIIEMDINIYLKNLDDSRLDALFNRLVNLIKDLDPEVFIKLVNSLKIGDIIENEINSFEIDFAEKLILDIAERELKAITNLGAVLGAILGLLSPLIKYL